MRTAEHVASHGTADGTLLVGGVPVDRLARWDGNAWSAFAPGHGLSSIYALALMPNGDVMAAGLVGLMRWNGVTWTSLGITGMVLSLQVMPNGANSIAATFAS